MHKLIHLEQSIQMKTKITKAAAIRHAKENVEIEDRGYCYKIKRYDEQLGMWREGKTHNYYEAKYFYAQAMLDAAAEYLNAPKVNYDGGSWIKYMKKIN